MRIGQDRSRQYGTKLYDALLKKRASCAMIENIKPAELLTVAT
jgi:hypothetical protein